DGLDGTELAISESQERMAVVVEGKDADKFMKLADSENLEATIVAKVTSSPRLVMKWRGEVICDIAREFLNSNGAEKHIDVELTPTACYKKAEVKDFASGLKELVGDLNICSKRGLSERFDSTIGAGTVLMPFGGKYQLTPNQAMVNKISLEKGFTKDCSVMAYGYNPDIAKKSPYHGAYLAVVESVSKLIASGADFTDVYLTFQEYFAKPQKSPTRWGQPATSLLGAFKAQLDLGIGSIGGKDSMSGSFEDIDVPPTLVSFAVTTTTTDDVVSGEFKKVGSKVYLIKPDYDENNLPKADSLIATFNKVSQLNKQGKLLACYTVTRGGIAESVFKMAIGNKIGFKFAMQENLFDYNYGAFIVETTQDLQETLLGETIEEQAIVCGKDKLCLSELLSIYEGKLEPVFSCNIPTKQEKIEKISYTTRSNLKGVSIAKPRVLIPVFPGTNCEYDSARAVEREGAVADIFVIKNLSSEAIIESVNAFAKKIANSQAIFIPGGFSGGDEPDGSGKFITAFFRNAKIKDAVTELLDERKGLMLGICNGFQALVKLGLVPFGKIIDTDESCPTLTFNDIGRHQSRLVTTRVASVKSPWLKNANVDQVYGVPISHGEGKFICEEKLLKQLIENGQIATQYVDLNGNPTYDIAYNPNGSVLAIEGITSPDGRVLGKMGHTERYDKGLYKNFDANFDMGLFKSLVEYYK
ncbi:MAG: phosphoribosylformylglycinamidine synthase subunit PurQ, partial [Clostridia bacterium]|nr:phosphoribosylformylglycinamidine synthase subunit PurQ [Clostridia bacterium]